MYSDTALRRSTRCLDLYRMRKEERRKGRRERGKGGHGAMGAGGTGVVVVGGGGGGAAAIGRSRILWPRSVDDEAQGH